MTTSVAQQLRYAIVSNEIALVRRILEAHPSYLHNAEYNNKSNTSLHLAAQYGLYEIADFLISFGHDRTQILEDGINVQCDQSQGISVNTDGQTPLHFSATNLQAPVTALLCQKFPSTINRPDQEGSTPLLLAAKAQSKRSAPGEFVTKSVRPAEDTSTAEVLLEYGADVGAQDHKGNTCLHNACAWGNLKVIRILIEAGADPLCSNYSGWMPGYYSLTVQAEVYYRNLVAEFETRKLEEQYKPKARHSEAAGRSIRMVSQDDSDADQGLPFHTGHQHDDSESDSVKSIQLLPQ